MENKGISQKVEAALVHGDEKNKSSLQRASSEEIHLPNAYHPDR